ncbi:tyrosine decarboxylase 1 isoform X2 [Phalaenopsis equestris]|uniref:tyrosine decarboxylase 1 isoform X2 n=1 Tax=Phalaenopsis equestris TaxID=78828 RepID=UPI0009E1A4B7|nr:tyrosine decarboxylase 1 isoform X2 [Phalaenopsis equestris]
MESRLKPMDAEQLRENAHMMVDFIADYYKNLESFPVLSQVKPNYLCELLPDSAPQRPESLQDILKDVHEKIIPGVTHWQSPNYFAYYPCNSSIAGFLGEMLSAGFNIVGFSWIASPAATELETIVLDWVAKMLKLPNQFLSSGIYPENLRLLKAEPSSSYALASDLLSEAIANDFSSGLIPFFLCATVGTTSSAAVDPLSDLGKIATARDVWFHVDAAYAGSACICPEYRHCINGVEEADSFGMNAHKWLLTNFDCSLLWVKDRSALIQSLSTNPEFLKNKASQEKAVTDFKDWQIPLGRRFRSLKLWMVLRMYGQENLQNYIRNHINLAKQFEQLVQSDSRFEVMAPRTFSLVCFRLIPPSNHEDNGYKLNYSLMDAINTGGKIFLSHTVLSGKFVLRFAVGAPLTEEKHVREAWKVLQKQADALLGDI